MNRKYNKTRKTCNRKNRVEIKLSDDELAVVKRKAKAAGIRKGTYIRVMSVQGELKFYDMGELVHLLIAFGRIGENVNQIAHVVNSNNCVTQKDVEDLQKEFSYFRDVMNNYLIELKPKEIL